MTATRIVYPMYYIVYLYKYLIPEYSIELELNLTAETNMYITPDLTLS